MATLTIAVAAFVAAPAQAASTRAEYVAQVDPICQSAIPAVKSSERTANRAVRRFYSEVVGGASPHAAYKRLVARTARVLFHLSDIVGGLGQQIAAVPPPPDDSGYVTLWVRDIFSAQRLMSEAAQAFRHRKFAAARTLWAQASAVGEEADRWVGSFGFQYCTG